MWLEPEGFPEHTDIVYPNGISTALPEHVQLAMVRSIRGLGRAEISQYGYAVEYDHVDPRQLSHALELKCIGGVFLAGQINGTTGYEEAAIQGLLAGANAGLKALSRPPLTLSREKALGGVLVDDLVVRGVTEPYRMFTSRAECRLTLRPGNADFRLTPIAASLGLLHPFHSTDRQRLDRFHARKEGAEEVEALLRATSLTPPEWAQAGIRVGQDGVRRSGWELLAGFSYSFEAVSGALHAAGVHLPPIGADVASHVAQEAGYARHVNLLRQHAADIRQGASLPLPDNLDFGAMGELRAEERLKLAALRPRTLGEAAAMEGLTASGLSVLLRHAHSRLPRPGRPGAKSGGSS